MVAEFHRIFCRQFLMSVAIADRGDGWDGWQGMGWEVTKTTGWSSHEANTMVHATLVGHGGSGSNPRSPPPNWHPPLVPLYHS